jgi:Tol biopolymer transport system component
MRKNTWDGSDLKIRFFLAFLTIFGMVVLAGTYQGNMVRGAGTGPAPRVTAIKQITHDGFRKTNLLADDSQLYVTELPASNRLIAKVTLPNSDRSVLPSPFSSLQALDLSPDHSKLLVSSSSKTSGDPEFWTVPVKSGAPHRVGDLTGRDGSWSADGKLLAFGKGASLYVANADGSHSHALYGANGSVFAVHFSPDGKRIRFTVNDVEQNATSLWEVNADGTNPHALLKDWPYNTKACCGTWTADGQYYIFQASQPVPNTSLLVTTLWALPETNDPNPAPAQITAGPMSFGNPSLSRDNKNIWAIGVQPSVDVVKYDAKKQKYVPLVEGLSATDVDYSADGKWIAFVSIPEGALWRARADGSDRLQLSPEGDRAALPHWSPDGKQIAYATLKQGGSWKLSLASAKGGDSHEMLPEEGSQIDANWSPDAKRLMFGDYSGAKDRRNIRILDFTTHKIEAVPGSDGLFSPRWSPDGRYIAALSTDFTTLMLYEVKTKKWSKWIQEPAGAVSYPIWAADSQSIYFDDLVNGAEAIRRVKVGENSAEEIFMIGSFDRYPGALGLWFGQAPDGSWMFVRDRSTQEVYQLSMELP